MQEKPSISLFSYLWPDNPSIKIRVILSLLCLLLGKVMSMYVPLLYKMLVDKLSNAQVNIQYPILIGFALAYSGARASAQIFNELRDLIFANVGQRAIRIIGLQVFQHLHKLSYRFHIMRKTGGLSRSIERGTKAIEALMRITLYSIVPTIIEIALICGVLWYNYSISFAFVTFATLALYVIYTIFISEKRVAYVKRMNDADNQANTKAVDSLLNFETVKYFCNEEFEANRFDLSLISYQETAVLNARGLSILNIGQNIIISGGLCVLMIMSFVDIEKGAMTIGDFVMINAYILQVSIPLYIIGYAYREIKASLISMGDMLNLMRIDEEIQDRAGAQDIKFKAGTIKFENVSFNYEEQRSILHDINFTIEAGKTMAIVGSTGSGKSTIARLLFRFYDVNSGSITIDDQDIRYVTQKSLRQIIGVVPQDIVLFNETIYYNILYGNTAATYDDVIRSAKLAHIHNFITSLPEGYNTIVGERGLKLSGGEKQRIGIARTALKNPYIYIFDEATSSLDSRTEAEIQSSLNAIADKHTTIIIAHRLSTVIHADQIIVLENGDIIERGTHKSLLKLNGKYAELWAKQQATVGEEIHSA